MKYVLPSLALVLMCAAPAYAFPPPKHTDWGPPAAFGDGEMRSFFTHVNDKPKHLGVHFTASMLQNTPTAPSDGKNDVVVSPEDSTVIWACCGHEIRPAFPPSVAELTSFDHAVMNFNPHGHPPPHVYTLPHIDLHFYTISNATREAIPGVSYQDEMCSPAIPMTCEDAEAVAAPLPADQQPPGYANLTAVEPDMGNHLIDLTSGEFNGEVFSHTFIFMTLFGELTGFEPMVTLEFFDGLRAQDEATCIPIRTPQAFPDAGYYPTEYCMEYQGSDDSFIVRLSAWEWFEASDGVVE